MHMPYVSLSNYVWCADKFLFLRFGWVNASYVYGLTIVNVHMKRALGACTPWETFYQATEQSSEAVNFGV